VPLFKGVRTIVVERFLFSLRKPDIVRLRVELDHDLKPASEDITTRSSDVDEKIRTNVSGTSSSESIAEAKG